MINKKIILITFLVLITVSTQEIVFAQDTIIVQKSFEQEKYINFLEKVNQQLSLYWNPYNTIMTILTALFAIFTIVFGVLIFFQSREYKQRLIKSKKEYQEKIDNLFEEIKKNNEKSFDSWILKKEEEIKKISKGTKIPKGKIQEMEKLIDELKREKELLKSPITVVPDYNNLGSMSAIFSGEKLHSCSHCKYTFKVRDYGFSSGGIALGGSTVTCPKCGNIDSI
jgi:hypothetical protein